MAHLIDNSFSSYELTDEEFIEGSILSIAQKQVIQNQIVMFAEQKLDIRYDPNNPILFAQQEAEKKGAIDALKFLISTSSTSEEERAFNESQDMREYNTVSEAEKVQQINDIFKEDPAVKPTLNIKPKT